MSGINDPAYYTPQDPYKNNPFSGAFDTRISYQQMIEQQQIAQYQQYNPTPVPLTPRHRGMVATMPRFQYGVPGGQTTASGYARTNAMARKTFSSYAALTAGEMAAWIPLSGAGAVIGGAVGMLGGPGGAAIGAKVGSFALPMMASGIATNALEGSMMRQRMTMSVANDLEANRNRLGFSNLSSGSATSLARSLTSSMSRAGEYFTPQKQMAIHKMAISEGLIDSRNASTDALKVTGEKISAGIQKTGFSGGSVRQYKKNFDELKGTVKEIVELLQTTVEGGMSVMKELKQKGFGDVSSIRAQVRQAKAYGDITGLGAQNMMQIGAAGAQAVQGTGLRASTGSNMYQVGTAIAGSMSRGDAGFRNTMNMAGGMAQTGASFAGGMMNSMMSRAGTYLAAAVTNKDGSVNNAAFHNFLSGKLSRGNIVDMARDRGNKMSAGERLMFPVKQQEFYNNMIQKNPRMAVMVNQGMFDLWREGKSGTREQQAYGYSLSQGMQGPEALANAKMLAGNKRMHEQVARENLAILQSTSIADKPFQGAWSKAWQRTIERPMETAGAFFGMAAGGVIGLANVKYNTRDKISAGKRAGKRMGKRVQGGVNMLADAVPEAYDLATGMFKSYEAGASSWLADKLSVKTAEQKKYGYRSKAKWRGLGNVLQEEYYSFRPRTDEEELIMQSATAADIDVVTGSEELLSSDHQKVLGITTGDMRARYRRASNKGGDEVSRIRQRLREGLMDTTQDGTKQLLLDTKVMEGLDIPIAEQNRLAKLKPLERHKYFSTISQNFDIGAKQEIKTVKAAEKKYETTVKDPQQSALVGQAYKSLLNIKNIGDMGAEDIVKKLDTLSADTYKDLGLDVNAVDWSGKSKSVKNAAVHALIGGRTKDLDNLPGDVVARAATLRAKAETSRKTLASDALGRVSVVTEDSKEWTWKGYLPERSIVTKFARQTEKIPGSEATWQNFVTRNIMSPLKKVAYDKGIEVAGGERELANMVVAHSNLGKKGGTDAKTFAKLYGEDWQKLGIEGQKILSADQAVGAFKSFITTDNQAKIAGIMAREQGEAAAYTQLVNERVTKRYKLDSSDQKAIGYIISGGKTFKTKFDRIVAEKNKKLKGEGKDLLTNQGYLNKLTYRLDKSGVTGIRKTSFDKAGEILRSGQAASEIGIDKDAVALEAAQSKLRSITSYTGELDNGKLKEKFTLKSKDGEAKEVLKKGANLDRIERATRDEVDRLQMKQLTSGFRESTRGASMDANVTAPSMNYWSNKWWL